jgi:HD superfamily phosphohydrolase
MSRPKFFRDPVHLQIRFEDVNLDAACPAAPHTARQSWLARKIIDCPIFQRLRFIRQNGLANLVFHGAEHTRFTHSIGVGYLAEVMHDRICRNMGEQQDDGTKLSTVVAALIHDLGHGPFSHTMEEILAENGVAFDHEKMTLRYILEQDSEVHRLIRTVDAELPQRLAKFFDKTLRDEDHWSYKIVSSQLDADRLDYLHRDALFAGIRGHGFDLERILDLLSHHDGKSIGVERGALEAIERILLRSISSIVEYTTIMRYELLPRC